MADSALGRSVADVKAKLESVIDAAESAAEEIRSAAQADAERYLRDRREEVDRELAERRDEIQRQITESAERAAGLAEPLLDRAEHLKREADGLARDLELAGIKLREATQTISVSDDKKSEPVEAARPAEIEPSKPEAPQPAPAAAPDAPSGPVPGPQPTAYPGSGEAASGGAQASREQALLRATQLAVAGSERMEIEAALRTEFGLSDPSALLDTILGEA